MVQQMEHLVQAIKHSLATHNWYSAVTLSLTLPDICGKLENPNLRSRQRYSAWFNQYVAMAHPGFLNGDDCYALRCAYLHQGEFDLEDQNAKDILNRIHFNAPDNRGNVYNDNIFRG